MSKRRASGAAMRSPRKRVRGPTGRAAAIQRRNIRIGGFVGIENKFVDYERSTNVDVSWAGNELDDTTALSLSAIAQGDGESQRDGRRVDLLSVHVKGLVNVIAAEAATAPQNSGIMRLILVLDKQTNGAQLNAEDVMTNLTFDVNSWRNLQNSQRFRILKDIRINMPVNNQTTFQVNDFSIGAQTYPFEMHVVFKKPIQVNHTGTTAVVTSIADNSIHLIGVCNLSTTGSIDYSSRVRFRG